MAQQTTFSLKQFLGSINELQKSYDFIIQELNPLELGDASKLFYIELVRLTNGTQEIDILLVVVTKSLSIETIREML